MPEAARPTLFFDRDGTLMDEVHYCKSPADVRVIPGIREALGAARAAGWLVILITNQSGIGRGTIGMDEYEAVHAEFLRQIGGELDAAFFCPDAPPTPSPRRKPEPGMILEAMSMFPVDRANAWMIGDKEADIVCGRRAGLRSMLVRTGYGARYAGPVPDGTAEDAVDAIRQILELHGTEKR